MNDRPKTRLEQLADILGYAAIAAVVTFGLLLITNEAINAVVQTTTTNLVCTPMEVRSPVIRVLMTINFVAMALLAFLYLALEWRNREHRRQEAYEQKLAKSQFRRHF